LRLKLDAAKQEQEEVVTELRKLEPIESRDPDRPLRKSDPTSAVIG
jgi:hypothetical protein